MIGDQPIGEYPPIDTCDLLPMELRHRALIGVKGACEVLASLIGVDLFPDFTSDFAALLRMPIASYK
ncbi:hypothetical protein [Mycobacteroides abscessus]|uniref:hypothetical protein n=1 Tax=Mycobacteroides abscessus TaxID=36809 RepID=UPI0009A5B104|nr:hypothetical protein [Mycobacteroides abscessus]MDM3950336.1 hypothetical protein [Mycobacteroides abscessus]SLJ14630.1 Uncharacterised protein [Mycobacteroides abscessus subsp. massiliense]